MQISYGGRELNPETSRVPSIESMRVNVFEFVAATLFVGVCLYANLQ